MAKQTEKETCHRETRAKDTHVICAREYQQTRDIHAATLACTG